jgi:hypothetical protein
MRFGGNGTFFKNFNGMVRDFRVYDQPLSEKDIANAYRIVRYATDLP